MPHDLEDFPLLNTASQLRRASDHAFAFYHGAIPHEECLRLAQDSYDLLAKTAKVTHHLVPLAEHWTIDRLRQLGIVQQKLTPGAPEILFIDLHDSTAAPIAAALLGVYARGRMNVTTAGIAPDAVIDPQAVEVLSEADVPSERLFPKPITDDAVQAANVIVLLGDIPDLPATGRESLQIQRWEISDLTGASYEAVQAARDDLDRRVLRLLAELL